MMHKINVEARMFFENEIAVGRAFIIERIVGDRGKRCLQPGQPLERGLRARIFFAVERETAVLAGNRHQALVEMSALDCGCRPLLALEAEFVDNLARDALKRRHRIGANALMRLRMPGAQAKITVVHHERALAATAFHRHHLGAAGDHEILRAGHDRIGGHVDAGDTGTAKAIQRDAAGAHVVAGIERRHPPEITALRTALGTGAPDDIVDIGGVDAGAIGKRAQYGGAELLRMDACQCALAGLADAARCPACVDDQRVNHGVSFGFSEPVDWLHLQPIKCQSQFTRRHIRTPPICPPINPVQSTLAPVALTISPQREYSLLMKAANPSGPAVR